MPRLVDVKAVANGDGSYILIHEYKTRRTLEPRSVVIADNSVSPVVDTLVYMTNKSLAPAILRLLLDGVEHTLRIKTNGSILSQMVDGKPLNHLSKSPGQGRR